MATIATTSDGNRIIAPEGQFSSTGKPATPIGLTATTTTFGITLSWQELTELVLPNEYRVYRSTTNAFGTASIIGTVPASKGTSTSYFDKTATSTVTYYYFVTAVSFTYGESDPSSVSSANPTQQITTFQESGVNTNGYFTGANPLTQSGVSTTILVASATMQFGTGSVVYNAGSVNPGGFGKYYVYADDPTYAGGAVTYQATLTQSVLTAADGRIYFGVITTAGGGGGTGGGGGGGCVEVGTPVHYPNGTTNVEEEVLPNSDWVALSVGSRKPIHVHPDTLVTVFKKASELSENDRIEVEDGLWEPLKRSVPFQKQSHKVKRSVKPSRVYYARGIRLHNLKPV